MYGDDNDSSDAHAGTFEIHKAEADTLFKQGDYKKAISSYTTALELSPNEKNCLVARSKCYLHLGDTEEALKDAEASLADDKTYHKGIYQKAEALYYKGDFEMSLVFFHRGHVLRPELQEFRKGIQKAQEAIDNAVGSPEKVKLTTEGDLSFFVEQTEVKSKKRRPVFGKYGAQTQQKQKAKINLNRTPEGEKTIKQLLGELYGDRIYLEKLLKETDGTTATGKTITGLVEDGLIYLDTRSEFWRQQKPVYARKHERMMQRKGQTAAAAGASPNEYIIIELEKIDQAQAEGLYRESLGRSQKLLGLVNGYSEDQVQGKKSIVANLYSCMGNSYLEMGKYEKALTYHHKDLDMGEQHKIEEAVSRGLDNLGRVYARSGKFSQAIDLWQRKVPLAESALERTWLYHEIGRCYLELKNYEEAKAHGEKSLDAAQEAEDQLWQLQATVLVAQSEAKLGNYQDSLDSFERANELAKILGDTPTEGAIKKAIVEVNEKIVHSHAHNVPDTIKEATDEEGTTTETRTDTRTDDEKAQDVSSPEASKSPASEVKSPESEKETSKSNPASVKSAGSKTSKNSKTES